jgi:hypothetical protein
VPGDAATPTATPQDQAEPQPQTGCSDCEGIEGDSAEDGRGPILAAGKSGHAIPGNANGLLRRADGSGITPAGAPAGNPGRGPRER